MKNRIIRCMACFIIVTALLTANPAQAQTRLPDGSWVYPDGRWQKPDGTVRYPDAHYGKTYTNTQVIYPNGKRRYYDRRFERREAREDHDRDDRRRYEKRRAHEYREHHHNDHDRDDR